MKKSKIVVLNLFIIFLISSFAIFNFVFKAPEVVAQSCPTGSENNNYSTVDNGDDTCTITFQTVGDPASDDTYVARSHPHNNYGPYEHLSLRIYSSDSSYLRHSLLRWSIPGGITNIVSAQLDLYLYSVNGTDNAGFNPYLKKITSDWDEHSVEWNTKPGYSDTISDSIDLVSPSTGWKTWTLNSTGHNLIESWSDSTESNYGMVLYVDVHPGGGPYRSFRSSDYLGDVSLHPKLVITYTKPSVGSNDNILPTISINGVPDDWTNSTTISVGCADNDSGCDSSSYRFRVYDTEQECPQNYDEYNLTSPQTITSHKWICAVAKDNDGNTGFSGGSRIWSGQSLDSSVDTVYNLLRASNGYLYAGTDNENAGQSSLYRSIDNGDSWSRTSITAGRVTALAKSNSGDIYAVKDSSSGNIVYKSTDNGSTWPAVNYYSINLVEVKTLIVADNGSLYAAGSNNGKIFRSTNEGNNWSELTDLGVQAIIKLYQASDGYIYAGTGNSGILYRADSGGNTWTQVATMLGMREITSIIESVNGSLYLTAWNYSGAGAISKIFSSSNGTSWTEVGNFNNDNFKAYDLIESSDSLFYAGGGTEDMMTSGQRMQIFKSDDNGSSWQMSNDFGNYGKAQSLVQSGSNSIYIGMNKYSSSGVSDIYRGVLLSKEIKVDSVLPTAFIDGVPLGWQNTDANLSVNCSDNLSGCDSSTYRFSRTFDQGDGSCPSIYDGNYTGSGTYSSPHTESEHAWYCATAKDNAVNSGFTSSRVEVKVDKILPEVTSFSVTPYKTNIEFSIDWTVCDPEDPSSSYSGVDYVELWRAEVDGAGPGTWMVKCNDNSFRENCFSYGGNKHLPKNQTSPANCFRLLGELTDTPPLCTMYFYGIHVIDHAGNVGYQSQPNGLEGIYDCAPPVPNPATGSASVNSCSQITWTINEADDGGIGIGLNENPYSFDNGSTWQASNVLIESGLSGDTNYNKTIMSRDDFDNRTLSGILSATTPSCDFSGPVLSATPSSSSGWNSYGTSITLGVSDSSGVSSARYRWNTTASSTQGIVFTDGTVINSLAGDNTLYLWGQDIENNESTSSFGDYRFDNLAPIVNSFSPNNNLTNSNPVLNFTYSDGGGSSIDHVEVWRQPSSGSWSNVSGSFGSSVTSWTDTTIISDDIYYYGLHVIDQAGNCINESGGHCGGVVSDSSDTRTSYGPDEVNYDTTEPTINGFTVDGVSYGSIANNTDGSPGIAWNIAGQASELDRIEIFRTNYNSSNCNGSSMSGCSWLIVRTDNSPIPISSWIDSVGDGEYWYGVHAIDTAGNVAIESDQGKGPIRVNVDASPPVVSVSGVPADWQNTNATASVLCSDSVSGCDNATYKLISYSGGGSCSTNYNDYNLDSPQDVRVHSWYCATAKNNVGTAGFSGNRVEFKIDKDNPVVSSFSVSPLISNSQFTIIWSASDSGGSELDYYELWRAQDSGGSPGTWTVQCSDNSFRGDCSSHGGNKHVGSGVVNTPSSDGTWWYGMHAVDNADNWASQPQANGIDVVYDTVSPPSPTCTPGSGNYVSPQTVFCSDSESGVVIRYTTNGVDPSYSSTQYTTSLIISSSTTLKVRAWDSADNVSNTNTYNYSFGNLPDTSIDSQPDLYTYSTSADFTFSGTNSPTSYECKLNSGAWEVCVSPKEYSGLSQTSYTFFVRAINDFGTDSTPASYTWIIDLAAPIVGSFSTNPSTNVNPILNFTYSDTGGSGIDHSEVWRAPDGTEDWSNVSGSLGSSIVSWTDTTISGDGTYKYGLHNIDQAGNCITESGSHCGGVSSDSNDPRTSHGPDSVIYDTTAPNPNPATGSANADSCSQITWTINSASDSGTGLHSSAYSFNDGVSWQANRILVESGLIGSTSYLKTVKSRDSVNNQTGSGTLSITTPSCDTGGPIISATPNNSSGWQHSSTGITLNVSDDSGVSESRYRWNVVASATQGTLFTDGAVINSSAGNNTLYLWAKDNFDNESTVNFGPYQLDQIAPIVGSFSTNPSTNVNPILNFTYSDTGGSGIDHSEVWRAPDGTEDWSNVSGSLGSSIVSWTDTTISGDGTYKYGLHNIDQAGNCITESGSHCGGVSSDSNDPRTSYGPDSVIYDTTAPIDLNCNPGTGNYTDAQTVSCSADNSTIIRYTLDGEDPTGASAVYSSPLNINSSATLKIKAWDQVENGSDVSSYVYTIGDVSETSIDSSPDSATFSQSVSFTFSGTNSPTGYECQLDSGGWGNCVSPKEYSGLSQASHTFQVRAINGFGTDPTPAIYTWIIDLTAPSVDLLDTDESTNTDPVINFDTSDSGGSGKDYIQVWRKPSSGEWSDVSGNLDPSWIYWNDTTVSGDDTYEYGLHVIDQSGNCITESGSHCGGVSSDSNDPRTSKGPDTIIYDTQDPVIDTFDVQPLITESTVDIAWSGHDEGLSGIDYYEVWRAPDESGVPGTWTVQCNDVSWQEDCSTNGGVLEQSSPIVDSPTRGDWWYGVHVIDVASNSADEGGPIKISKQGNQSPGKPQFRGPGDL